MKPNSSTSAALRALTIVVRAALWLPATGAVHAEDPAVAALTQPTSVVEIGVGHSSSAAAQAHAYDGLKQRGAYFIGAFDLRGGGRHDSDDNHRWRIWGLDLGTASRSLGFEQGVQGRSRFSARYDELQYQRSDSYQTPLVGAGSNRLTLPATWIVPVVPRVSTTAANARGLLGAVTASNALVAGVSTAPTPAMLAQAATLQATDGPLFQPVTLGTQRRRFEFAALVNLGTRWDVTARLQREERSGLKPMGTVTRFTGGDIATIIPDLIDQDHHQVTLGLNYTGDGLVLQTHYHLSTLTNNVPSMTWGNWATPGSNNNLQTMSSAPGNALHQFGIQGHYKLGSSTRLAFSLSHGRQTQNEPFLTDSSTPLVPVASLGGLVVSQTASLKLTSRPLAGLNLGASYRFDERDNRTPVNTYGYYDAGEPKTGISLFNAAFPTAGLGANANLNANRPYSRKLHQARLDASYALAPGQVLQAGYEQSRTERWCAGSWIACADAHTADEQTLRGEWQFSALEVLSGRIALSRGQRSVDYNENAFLAGVPMANVSPSGAPNGSTAYGTLLALGVNGWGPALGLNPLPPAGSAAAFFFANNNALANSLYGNQNRISELPGLRRHDMADRTRDQLRSSLNWQAASSLSLQASVDVHRDNYTHSVYGLQHARGWAATLDGSFAAGEDLALSAFATIEDQRSRSTGNTYTANSAATLVNGFTAISGGCFGTIALRNANNKIDPSLNWQSDVRDRSNTFGLAAAWKKLLAGQLDLNAVLTVSDARSRAGFGGGNYVNNPLAVAGAPAGTVAAAYIAATPLPDVTTRSVEARLGAVWRLDDSRAMRLGYRYQQLRSSDWAYEGMQFGGLAGVLPTLELSPAYTVHTVGLSYVLSFR